MNLPFNRLTFPDIYGIPYSRISETDGVMLPSPNQFGLVHDALRERINMDRSDRITQALITDQDAIQRKNAFLLFLSGFLTRNLKIGLSTDY